MPLKAMVDGPVQGRLVVQRNWISGWNDGPLASLEMGFNKNLDNLLCLEGKSEN